MTPVPQADTPVPGGTGLARNDHSVPHGTSVLFSLLVAAVLASSMTVTYILFINLQPMDLWLLLFTGVGLLVVVALFLYGMFPWRIRQRHALVPISAADTPDLHRELLALCELAQVAAPRFMLAPYAASASGLAFGHLGQRCVKLDAGLLALRHTDPAAFRAVVLHELGHLHYRDVDIAYLTVAVWRSFVLLVCPPLLVMAALPGLLSGADSRWSLNILGTLRVGGGLGALTLVVFLIRNALLRQRELYADGFVGQLDVRDSELGVADGLVRLLTKAPLRRRNWLLRYFDHHPSAQRRVRALREPSLVPVPRAWELFGVGLVTAVVIDHVYLLFSQAIVEFPDMSAFLTGTAAAAGVAACWFIAVWRAGSVTADGRAPAHVLLYPLLTAAGLLAGSGISLMNLSGGRWTLFNNYSKHAYDPFSLLLTMAPLVVGGVLTIAWSRSSIGVLQSLGTRRRSAAITLVVTLVVAIAPWLTVWLTLRPDIGATMAKTGVPTESWIAPIPANGLTASLVRSLELITLWPRQSVFVTATLGMPLAQAGIVLLWLVPAALLLGRRQDRAHSELRKTLLIAVGLLVAAGGAFGWHLYQVADALRSAPQQHDIMSWARVNFDVWAALLVLAEALGCAAVVLAVRRHRVVFAGLAVSVIASAGAGVFWLGLGPLNCAAIVGQVPSICWRPLSLGVVNEGWYVTTLYGLIAGIPLSAAAAFAALLWRHFRRAIHVRSAVPAPSLIAEPSRSGVALAVSALLLVTGADILANRHGWVSIARTPNSPRCLVGTWVEESYQHRLELVAGIIVEMRRTSVVRHYRDDGTLTIDFGANNVESGLYNGGTVTLHSYGILEQRYAVKSVNEISYSSPVSRGQARLSVRGVQFKKRPLRTAGSEEYTCDSNRLTVSESSYTAEYRRKTTE